MNTTYQPGQHPDPHPGPDQLSAFADHALPPHEQQQTLAHLATCPDCRNLLCLAQQANPIEFEAPQPTARRPWFLSWNLAWPAAALAGLVLLTLHLHKPTVPAVPTTTASIQQPPPSLPAAPEILPASPATLPLATPQRKSAHSIVRATIQAPPSVTGMASGAGVATTDAMIRQAVSAPPPPQALGGLSLANLTTATALHGTITDPTGAAISRARITATNTLTGASLSRETSATGDFLFTSLPSGTYNVEAAAPGFQSLTEKDIHVEAPTQLALNLKLPIGSASQTVTVTDAPPALDAASATLGGTIENQAYTNLPLKARTSNPVVIQPPPPAAPPLTAGLQQGIYGGTGQTNLNQNYVEAVPTANATLASKSAAPAAAKPAATAAVARAARQQLPTLPSHLPTLSTIANAHHTLAIDTAGALFRSEDSGVTWLPVLTQWKGRATRLTLTTPATLNTLSAAKIAADQRSTPPPTFQLTTDTGALYTSPDGQTWRLK